MPGSVRRSDSTRSDSSTDSRKKVSFNRAVKVKKYSRPLKHSQQGATEISPEKRFWFKVYKNRHNEEPDLVKESREYNGEGDHRSEEEILHQSQTPAENLCIRKDHVKQIVNQFNQESVIKPYPERQTNGDVRPIEPPADYGGGSNRYPANGRNKQKRNPLVNGVKVMFGMNSLKKKSKEQRKNIMNSKKYQGNGTRNEYSEDSERGPHTTNIVIPDSRKPAERSVHHSNSRVSSTNGSNVSSKRNGYSRSHYSNATTTDSWDSGNRLVLDVSQFDTSVDDTSDGKFTKTLEQNHRMWTREKTIRYDEPLFEMDERNRSVSDNNVPEIQAPPRSRRKGKVSSKEETKVSSTSPDAYKKKTRKEDKAIQCDEFWDESEESWDSEQLSELENCRIIKSKNGFVSAFSDVPSLEKQTDVVYSQVDKSKKKKRPPMAVPVDISIEEAKAKEDSYYKHTNVKTTTKTFGLKLKNGFQENVYDTPVEKDWYDVDGELEDATRSRRMENGDESSDAETAPSSVIREVDYKKREISYENVPRKEAVRNGQATSDRLWFHKVDDDYRRDMVQTEPNSDLSYSSLQRRGKRTDDVSMGRSYTLDRHRTKGQHQQYNNVKILVNGKEVNEQSENKCIRGGLAASYQTRQRALQRSNSSAARMFSRSPNNRLSPSRGQSSAASGISSSDSETSRRRKPVVLYIPGVSHPDRTIEEDDRSSGINVARTQSMLSSSKPAKYRSRTKTSRPPSSDKSDLSRSNSMPRNVKFPWFKWKVRAKPSREP